MTDQDKAREAELEAAAEAAEAELLRLRDKLGAAVVRATDAAYRAGEALSLWRSDGPAPRDHLWGGENPRTFSCRRCGVKMKATSYTDKCHGERGARVDA